MYSIVYISRRKIGGLMKLRHLVLLAGLVAGGNAPVPAAASDGLLAGPPRTVHKQFNVASRKFNSRQRMILTECSGAADVQTCNYTVTGRLALVAWSQEGNKEKLQSVTLLCQGLPGCRDVHRHGHIDGGLFTRLRQVGARCRNDSSR